MSDHDEVKAAAERLLDEAIRISHDEPDDHVLMGLVRDITDVARAYLAATEWQDIATAPKDGTYILGYFPMRKGFAMHQDIQIVAFTGHWWHSPVCGSGLADTPTLWRPLPVPPADDGEPVSEWRDIATAPKDSHAILIWCPEYQNIYAVTWCEWHGWCVFGAGSHERLQQEPTHWRPLPPPPARAAGEDAKHE